MLSMPWHGVVMKGLSSTRICYKCKKQKEFNEFNKDKSKVLGIEYICRECKRQRDKDWYKRRPHVRLNYHNKKYKEDPLYRLQCIVRNNVTRYLKNGKNKKTEQIIGCTWLEFQDHIEKQFTEGMTWDNQGSWHLDHIIPLASANTEEEIYKLNHYTNFQPLWAEDNYKKGSKILWQD
jgi:hypothetical protein